MKSAWASTAGLLAKAPSGIPGFDQITCGGLTRGRTTLPVGGPGSGKTNLARRFLARGAAVELDAQRIVFDALDIVREPL